MSRSLVRVVAALGMLTPTVVSGQSISLVRDRVHQEQPRFLATLKDLVSIESGSADVEGVLRIGTFVADLLRALGGEVEAVDPPADMVRFETTPPRIGRMVVARFRGTGTTKILLLGHLDTVYPRGSLARNPFRIEGDRIYGPGIADDKQGVALILHALSIVRELGTRNYGLITVLLTPDEEISSPGSRSLTTKLGSEHDIVLSCEPIAGHGDGVLLATTGTAAVHLKVKGRSSHAGVEPEKGRNALYELAHQIMRTRDLSDSAAGVKMNWTLASAGSVRNVIPEDARATADVRVERVADYDVLERKLRERLRTHLIEGTTVDLVFERMRPPLEVTEASRLLARAAVTIAKERGDSLAIYDRPVGATDAAYAAVRSKAPVLEGLGAAGSGFHSSEAEYVVLSSIEPRLYLLTRLIMDAAEGRLNLRTE